MGMRGFRVPTRDGSIQDGSEEICLLAWES